MKKSGFFTLAVAFAVTFVLLQSAAARAQWGVDTSRDRRATPMTVATLYHIMQRKVPDLRAWAMETEAYKNASGFDKNIVLDQQIAQLKEEFMMISPFDPLVIHTRVRLSPYSSQTKGYLIRGITRETYFSYTHMDTNYAIVIPKLMDYEWIGVEGDQARKLEAAAEISPAREVVMKIKLRINYADKNPVTMQKKPYYLMSGDILTIELYDRRDDSRALWWMDSKDTLSAAQQELLNLKR